MSRWRLKKNGHLYASWFEDQRTGKYYCSNCGERDVEPDYICLYCGARMIPIPDGDFEREWEENFGDLRSVQQKAHGFSHGMNAIIVIYIKL